MPLNQAEEKERARSALYSINSGCDRDTWLKLIAAAKAAGLDFETVNNWSSSAANYTREKDVRSAWTSLKEAGGITAGTLFYYAKESGWESENQHTKSSPRNEKPKQTKVFNKPAHSPQEIWDSCVSAGRGHAYISKKDGLPDGLRVYPTHVVPLIISGQNMAGWLVLPMCDLKTGELKTLQFIPSLEGKKLNLPGHALSGAFVIGTIEPNKPCYVVEGIGQAWTANKATEAAAVVTFGAHRIEEVALSLRGLHPKAQIVLVADVGKREKCRQIAVAIGSGWVSAPDDLGNNGDINDMEKRDGLQSVANLLANIQFPPQRFPLLSATDLLRLPSVQWIVKGVLPSEGLVAIYGPSGSGKSFLVLDLLACISRGQSWFGRRVKSAPVIYCALEGEAGLAQRMRAYQEYLGQACDSKMRFMIQPFSLLNKEDISGLAEAIGSASVGGGVVVLDTLNRAAPGADENSSEDMGNIIASCKRLQGLIGGLVVLVHHTGKDAAKGLRGHSSLFAALDAAVEVNRSEDRREWKVAKSKDGRDGDAEPFHLEEVHIGKDDDGELVTSCVVVRGEHQGQEKNREPKLTSAERNALKSLQKMLGTQSIEPPEYVPEWVKGVVTGDVWRSECYSSGISTSDNPSAKRKAFMRSRQGLMDKGVVHCRNDLYWDNKIAKLSEHDDPFLGCGTQRDKSRHVTPHSETGQDTHL